MAESEGYELSEEQIEEYKDTFELFADNEEGPKMSVSELGNAMRALGCNPTEADLKEIMKSREDKESGGNKMDIDEFLSIMQKHQPSENKQDELVNAFKFFDKDGNQFISAAELRAVMINIGEKLTEEEADEMIREAAPNSEGHLDYEDFAKYMTSN